MNYFINTLHHSTPNGRYELNKLASLPMCGFIAQLEEQRTGSRVRVLLKPWFFQASSFQLLKLENLLRWSFFTLTYNRSSNIWIISYILHITFFIPANVETCTSQGFCPNFNQINISHRRSCSVWIVKLLTWQNAPREGYDEKSWDMAYNWLMMTASAEVWI